MYWGLFFWDCTPGQCLHVSAELEAPKCGRALLGPALWETHVLVTHLSPQKAHLPLFEVELGILSLLGSACFLRWSVVHGIVSKDWLTVSVPEMKYTFTPGGLEIYASISFQGP